MILLVLGCVFVEGYIMSNKVDGIVDCKIRPRSCWKLLWFVDNQLLSILEHLMRVFLLNSKKFFQWSGAVENMVFFCDKENR